MEHFGSINDLEKTIQNDDNFFNFLFQKKKSSTYFIKASIFDKEKYKEIKKNFNPNSNFSKNEKSCMGSMLGMVIGDAMGARVEFQPLSYTNNNIKDMGNSISGKFNLKPGQWTDDTSMSLCIADSLITKEGEFNPKDIMMRFLLWWNNGYNNSFRFDHPRHSVGLGGNISGSFQSYIDNYGKYEFTIFGNKYTSGNGSIMRNTPIPICYYKNINDARKYAKLQSKITHQGFEASCCCELLSFIIVKILNGNDLKEILNNLEKEFICECESVNYLAKSKQEGNDKNRNWNWKDKNFKYSEERVRKQSGYIGSYCMDGLAMALHVLYYTNSFKDAILKVVNLRGDSDSVGSVVGQIAGAYYGIDNIPNEWIKIINQWDDNEIALRGYILFHLFDNVDNNSVNDINKKFK